MIRFIGTAGIAVLLVACNGGSEPPPNGDAANPEAATAETPSAPTPRWRCARRSRRCGAAADQRVAARRAGHRRLHRQRPRPAHSIQRCRRPVGVAVSRATRGLQDRAGRLQRSRAARRRPGPDDEPGQLRWLPFAPGHRRHQPAGEPAVQVRHAAGATNKLPSFITAKGPVREARFVRNADGSPDGGVHGLFTIAGRNDAGGCSIASPTSPRGGAQQRGVPHSDAAVRRRPDREHSGPRDPAEPGAPRRPRGAGHSRPAPTCCSPPTRSRASRTRTATTARWAALATRRRTSRC